MDILLRHLRNMEGLSMDFFLPVFWSALVSIIIIDLVLAGDNAVIIGMAARNLPPSIQLKAILWGTAGAITIRIFATIIVVWLLKIPGLLIIGGLLLIWIAYRLLIQKKDHSQIQPGNNIWGAVRTIIAADAVMGLDNVIAIAGAAHGNIILVVLGLFVSVPIIIWGSTLIIKWIERYSFIIYIGAGILAFTAGKMITQETWVKNFFLTHPIMKWTLIAIITSAVIGIGLLRNQTLQKANI